MNTLEVFFATTFIIASELFIIIYIFSLAIGFFKKIISLTRKNNRFADDVFMRDFK